MIIALTIVGSWLAVSLVVSVGWALVGLGRRRTCRPAPPARQTGRSATLQLMTR